MEAILEADQSGQRVLGIDGFVLRGTSIQPNLEHCRDFSTACNRGVNTNREAIRFVKARKHLGLHFEIVLNADEGVTDPEDER